MISISVDRVDDKLLDAIKREAWDLHSMTTVSDVYVAVLGGEKVRWQVAFNEQAGKAAAIAADGDGPIQWVDAKNPTDAAYQASKA